MVIFLSNSRIKKYVFKNKAPRILEALPLKTINVLVEAFANKVIF
jgi:hypothetical protein